MDTDRALMCALTGERDGELIAWAMVRRDPAIGHRLWFLAMGVGALIGLAAVDRGEGT